MSPRGIGPYGAETQADGTFPEVSFDSVMSTSFASGVAFPSINSPSFDLNAILAAGAPLYDRGPEHADRDDYADVKWEQKPSPPATAPAEEGTGSPDKATRVPPQTEDPDDVDDTPGSVRKPKESRKNRRKWDDLVERTGGPPLRRAVRRRRAYLFVAGRPCRNNSVLVPGSFQCDFCTRRRRRCDGVAPSCSTCLGKNM